MSKITFRKGKNPMTSFKDAYVWFLYFNGQKHKSSRVISVLYKYDGELNNEIAYYLVMCNGDYIRGTEYLEGKVGIATHYKTLSEAKHALVAKFIQGLDIQTNIC